VKKGLKIPKGYKSEAAVEQAIK